MQSCRSLEVSIADQCLHLIEDGQIIRSYPVSTAARGTGSEPGSLQTPLGRFCVAEKIGHGEPPGMVFRGRQPTGEYGEDSCPDDLITSRILWLEGLELENANTRDRYIYIHGTNHESEIGLPVSHGCIRMRNLDIIDLFDVVDAGIEVQIHP